jgi:hypothetical protein
MWVAALLRKSWVTHGSNRKAGRGQPASSAQEAHDTACALQFPELGKDEEQTCLHFFIGIEDDHPCAVMSEPRGQRQA